MHLVLLDVEVAPSALVRVIGCAAPLADRELDRLSRHACDSHVRIVRGVPAILESDAGDRPRAPETHWALKELGKHLRLFVNVRP